MSDYALVIAAVACTAAGWTVCWFAIDRWSRK